MVELKLPHTWDIDIPCTHCKGKNRITCVEGHSIHGMSFHCGWCKKTFTWDGRYWRRD